MKTKWAGPACQERPWGFFCDEPTYRWQHVASGRIVSRTKEKMHEEQGVWLDLLNGLVSGRIRTSGRW